MYRLKQAFHESFDRGEFVFHFYIFVIVVVIFSGFNSYYCGDGISIESCIQVNSIEECHAQDDEFKQSLSDGYCMNQYSMLVAKGFIISTFFEEAVFLVCAFLLCMFITIALGLKSKNRDSKNLSWLVIFKDFCLFTPIWFSGAYAFMYMMGLYVS